MSIDYSDNFKPRRDNNIGLEKRDSLDLSEGKNNSDKHNKFNIKEEQTDQGASEFKRQRKRYDFVIKPKSEFEKGSYKRVEVI